MLTVYGIKQCDTCRKALNWLAARGTPHQFHDLRADGLDRATLQTWLTSDFADQLVNRRSTTWRQLDKQQQASSGPALASLLLENPTLVKRPVFTDSAHHVLAVGFNPADFEKVLGS